MVDLLEIHDQAFRSLGVIVILLITHSVLISLEGRALQSYVSLRISLTRRVGHTNGGENSAKIRQHSISYRCEKKKKKKNSSFSSNMNNN